MTSQPRSGTHTASTTFDGGILMARGVLRRAFDTALAIMPIAGAARTSAGTHWPTDATGERLQGLRVRQLEAERLHLGGSARSVLTPTSMLSRPRYGAALALFLALGAMLCVPARPAAAAQNSCKRSCSAEQRACRAAFKVSFQTSKANCTGTGKAKRQCVKTAGRIFQNAVKACRGFASTCRSCCKAGGTGCDAQCGDGIVADGEACDPPGGDSCAGGAICGGSCQCVAAAVSVDEARAATKTFPPEGGSLEATAVDGTVYSLTIPPGALLLETPIAMTPIVSIAGGDLPAGSVLGVDLQPSGLRLYEFAELRITSPQLGPTADIAGFSYEGAGDDLHRYPAALEAGRILLHVIHFSGAGATICVQLCPPPIDPPPPPITESELEALIAQLDPHDPFYAARLTELLHAYYDLFIAPSLPLMEQNCEYAASRVPKVLAWLLAQKPWIVPIPGTTKLSRLDENIGAVGVELTADDLREIDDAAAKITVQGARYPERLEQMTGR